MLILILAVLGLCLGSFVNALVWRLKNKKDFIKGRSQCVHCKHTLSAVDLVPVASWLLLRGRCRYCQKPIGLQYPLVEIIAALVFVSSYLFWPIPLAGTGDMLLFATWLAASVGLLALAVYDLRWMILPNAVIYPTLILVAVPTAIYGLVYAGDIGRFFAEWIASVIIASGVFYLLFVISAGKWIGDGDIRLGLVTGTILHDPTQAALMIFLASVLGSLAVLPLLVMGKKKLSGKLPFGPFLIMATFLCLLFGQQITDWYQSLILP